MTRQNKGCIPVEAIAQAIDSGRADRASLASPKIPTNDHPVLTLGIEQIRIVRIDPTNETVTAVEIDPILVDRPASPANRRTRPGAVVLQPTCYPVRLLGADRHMIELTDRCGVDMVPCRPAIMACIDASIASDDHVSSIARINP